jgi:hypothetical protein
MINVSKKSGKHCKSNPTSNANTPGLHIILCSNLLHRIILI